MLAINSMHGNDAILKAFCGVSQKLPIWGEIQHSFWETRRFRNHRESKLFSKLFTWNNLLKFPNEIPIGDPFFYLNHFHNSINCQNQESNYVLVTPKLRRNLSKSERFEQYLKIFNHVSDIFPKKSKLVKLHTDETLLFEIGYYLNQDSTWGVYGPANLPPIESQYANLSILTKCDELVSDYLGPHVIRRFALGRRDSVLIENWKSWRGIDDEIQDLYMILLSESANLESKISASEVLLGKRHIRGKDELRELLGLYGVKSIIGPSLSKTYKKINKSKLA